MLVGSYVFSLLFLPFQLSLHILVINASSNSENAALPQILVQNASVTSQSSILLHPTGGFNAGPSLSNSSSHSTAAAHPPFSSSPPRSTPVSHLSASQPFHAPVTQRPSSPNDPIPHHPPNPIPSHPTSHQPNSSDLHSHLPFHPHPSPPTPSTQRHSSGPSVTQIFFEALGGFIGLIVVLAVARCIHVYRRTPVNRRPSTPEIGEVERTLALLRPGRVLNLGDRIIPPPPYQRAPDYDSVVSSSAGGTESTDRHPSTSTNTTANLTSTPIRANDAMSDIHILTSPPSSASIAISNAIPPLLSQLTFPNPTDRPPDVHVQADRGFEH